MNFTFNREAFLSVFQSAAAVAPSRSPKAILDCVKLEVTDSTATLMATDMEIGIRAGISIEKDMPGSVLLPVARFGAFLRECRDESLTLEVDSESVVVRGQSGYVKFQAQDPDEFPPISTFEAKDYFQVQSKRLKELIKRTVFATDSESSRYALGGVLFDIEENTLFGVATDGRRLAKMEVALEATGSPSLGDAMTIVPANNLQLLERILPDDDSMVDFVARNNDIVFRVGDKTVYSRLVDGRFPRWRDVFPERPNAKRLNINAGPLHMAIRQTAVVAIAESRGIDFRFTEGSLVLSLTAADVGQSEITLPISYDGEEIVITLDFRYVTDFLKVLDPETMIELEIEDDDAAALCRTDDGYGYVIMPLARDRR